MSRLLVFQVNHPLDCLLRINYVCAHPDRKKEPMEKCRCPGARFPQKCPLTPSERGVAVFQPCPRCGYDTWHKLTPDGLKCLDCRKRKETKR